MAMACERRLLVTGAGAGERGWKSSWREAAEEEEEEELEEEVREDVEEEEGVRVLGSGLGF